MTNLVHYAVLLLFYSSFYLINVTGILNLQMMMFACCLFLVVNFIADMVAQLVNDKSQVAKNLLFMS